MWMNEHIDQPRYDRHRHTDWREKEDGCYACMLARIGSNIEILIALRAGMVARMKESKSSMNRNSKRMRWVSAWFTQFTNNPHSEEFKRSQQIGMKLKRAKRTWEQQQKKCSAETGRDANGDLASNGSQQSKTVPDPEELSVDGSNDRHYSGYSSIIDLYYR